MGGELREEMFTHRKGSGSTFVGLNQGTVTGEGKNRSGIPGMGQRWQAVLKYRMIMIPLPETTAAGAAFGVCRSVEGCCGASGSQPDGSCI